MKNRSFQILKLNSGPVQVMMALKILEMLPDINHRFIQSNSTTSFFQNYSALFQKIILVFLTLIR